MKRLLLLLVTVCTLFYSCASNPIPTDLLSDILKAFPEESGGLFYFSGSDEYSEGYLPAGDFAEIYADAPDAVSAYELLDSFAIYLSARQSGFEIHVLRVSERSDTEQLAGLLMRRIDLLQSGVMREYSEELYDDILKHAEIYIVHNYVFLLSTPDNAAAKVVINTVI